MLCASPSIPIPPSCPVPRQVTAQVSVEAGAFELDLLFGSDSEAPLHVPLLPSCPIGSLHYSDHSYGSIPVPPAKSVNAMDDDVALSFEAHTQAHSKLHTGWCVLRFFFSSSGVLHSCVRTMVRRRVRKLALVRARVRVLGARVCMGCVRASVCLCVAGDA